MSNSSDARRLAYFALDVPHKGQASHIHISEVINNLRRIGWQIDLYAPPPVAKGQTRRAWERTWQYSRAALNAIVRLHRYDVLYVRAHPLAWPVTMWARCLRKVIAQEVNGTELDVIVSHPILRPIRPFVSWLYRSQYRAADCLFPVTKELGQWLRAASPKNTIKVVPNGANTDLFHPIAREGVAPFAVFFGGLTAWHGVDLMIDALRHPAWPNGVELVVIGAGANEGKVQEAERSGLPVRWLGYRPYEQIPGLIAGAIAGLIPITNPSGRSSTGISPLKLYETLACGIPAVVTDLPGQAEVVREGDCGIVIPCDDAAALAKAVAQFAADPVATRVMGDRAAAFVLAQHSWAARAAAIDKTLQASLQQRS